MAYLKPSFVAAKVNALVARTGGFRSDALTVAGRRTGEPRVVPVSPVTVAGRTYVVSARGESDWVRNVRAAGRVTLGRGDGARVYAARELPVAERGPVLTAYREQVGGAVKGYWEKLPDDADHPVFELTPASGSW